MLNLEEYSLEYRFKRIIKEIKRIPDTEELDEVPYFTKVHDAIKEHYGSLDAYLKATNIEETLQVEQVPFPSAQQIHTMVTIAERERVIIGDEPGTRKTAAAGLAKYTIEEKLKKKVKTL